MLYQKYITGIFVLLLSISSFSDSLEGPADSSLFDSSNISVIVPMDTIVLPKPVMGVVAIHDVLGRATPRGSIQGFLDAVELTPNTKALEYLDLSGIPKAQRYSQGLVLVKQLKSVIDQRITLDFDSISPSEEGSLVDSIDSDLELLAMVKVADGIFEILLQRIDVDSVPLWKISASTVEIIPAMFASLGGPLILDYLPSYFLEHSFLYITLGEWLFFLLTGAFSFLIGYIAVVILLALLKKYSPIRYKPFKQHLARPILFLTTTFLGTHYFSYFVYSITVKNLLHLGTFRLIIIMWAVFQLSDFMVEVRIAKQKLKGNLETVVLLSLFKKIFKLIAVVVTIAFWLDNYGFNISTIIAGLGVGGIAFALAAQKSLEDMLGAMMLLGSKPVQIGDFVKFGDYKGTIEHISLRLTQVRTLDRSVVSIPNGKFASMELENLSKRDSILFKQKFLIEFSAHSSDIQSLLETMRDYLQSHSLLRQTPAPRLRFTTFGTYSFELDLFAYILETDYSAYLKIKEEINLALLDIVHSSNATLAIPSQKNYTGF